MKRLNQALCLVAFALCCLSGAAMAEDKTIAIVDMNRLFEEYTRTVSAKQKMEQQAAAFKTEVSEQIASMKSLEENFNVARQEAYDMALSGEVREQRKVDAETAMLELQALEKEVTQIREERKKELADASSRLIQSILDEIKRRVDDFAKSSGFFMVLDSSGSTLNRLPAVVYHDGSTDITDRVLRLLNSSAAGELTGAAEE